jgi:hypothetical protein
LRAEYLESYKSTAHLKISDEQKKIAKICFILTKTIKYLYISCAVLLILFPLLATIITKERILPFGFIFRWIEPYGNPGFFLNFVHHALQVYFTLIGVITTDSVYLCSIMLFFGKMSSIKLMFDDLIEQCRQHENDAKKLEEISKKLIKIIEMHQVLLKCDCSKQYWKYLFAKLFVFQKYSEFVRKL